MTGLDELASVDLPPKAPTSSGKAHQWSRRRKTVVGMGAGVVVVAALVALLFWPDAAQNGPGAAGLQVDRSVKPAGPVAVAGADALLIWRSTPDSPVSIWVKNRTSDKVRTKVWWTLAKASETEPWLHNAMQAQPIVVELHGNETKSVAVPIPPGKVKAGFYRLSLWAHNYDPKAKAWVHSDGRAVLGSIQVIGPQKHFRHVPAVSDDTWISDVEIPKVWTSGASAQLTVSVVDALPESQVVQAWAYLAPEGTKEPWKSDSAVKSEVVTAGTAGGAVTRIVVPFATLPRAGRYELSVWLHKQSAETSDPVDGAFMTSAVAVTSHND